MWCMQEDGLKSSCEMSVHEMVAWDVSRSASA